MAYSKITKNGQLTVPVNMRKKFRLRPGTRVSFSEREGNLVIKPLPDIVDSAGSLAQYAKAEEVLRRLLRERERPFRQERGLDSNLRHHLPSLALSVKRAGNAGED